MLAGLERDELPVLVDYVQQVARLHARSENPGTWYSAMLAFMIRPSGS